MYKKIFSVLIPLFILFSVSAYPFTQQINFQGRLTSSDATPITTSRNVDFKLFDQQFGGSQIGSTISKAIIPDNNGNFSTTLGFDQSYFVDGSDRYLQAQVQGDPNPLLPRQKIGAVPYAYRAITAESLSVGGAGNYVLKAGDTMIGTLKIEADADPLIWIKATVGSGALMRFEKNAGGYWNAGMRWDNKYVIAKEANEYFIIDNATGNVGIGTTDATSKLTVAGTISEGGTLLSSKYVAIPGSSARGDILMRDGTGWTRLAAGTNGQYLKTQGAGADPAWSDAAGGLGGSGTTGYISKFTAASTLGNSVIYENSGSIGIGSSETPALLSLKKTLPSGAMSTLFTAEAIKVGIDTQQQGNITGMDINLASVSGGVFNLGTARGLNIDVTGLPGPGGTGKVYGATIMGGNVGIGTAEPSVTLEVNGRIKDKTGYVMPVGTILPYAGATPPAGWLMCTGESLSTTTYADLFAVIQYTYGGSSGNFNVPDMRDRVPVGASATKALASYGGNETPTTSTVGDHSHAVNGGTLFEATAVEASSYGGLSSGGAVSSVAQNAGGHSHTVSSMQPYRAINFIIKY